MNKTDSAIAGNTGTEIGIEMKHPLTGSGIGKHFCHFPRLGKPPIQSGEKDSVFLSSRQVPEGSIDTIPHPDITLQQTVCAKSRHDDIHSDFQSLFHPGNSSRMLELRREECRMPVPEGILQDKFIKQASAEYRSRWSFSQGIQPPGKRIHSEFAQKKTQPR